MASKSCDHIKPCNIGTSELHNGRDPEYVKTYKDRHGNSIRTELTPDNESWVSEQMAGRDLQTYYNDIAIMVKEKTGRAMQTKARIKVDKKTGKKKEIQGSSPLRESSVNIKSETTMEDLRRYTEMCRQRWGITAIQIHIHRDEGHYEDITDPSTWKPNLHAHIVWDWMNHETGKSWKLNKKDMSEVQDYAAECLGMERGKSKAETGADHLERNDYILAHQQKEMAANNEKLAEQEQQLSEQQQAIDDKKAENEALDKEREEKRQKLNDENGSKFWNAAAKIGSGVANTLGFGDLHDANDQIEKLKAENQALKESVPNKIAELNASFKTQVNAAAEKKVKPLNDKIASLEGEKNLLDVKIGELKIAKSQAESEKNCQAAQHEQRIRWRDTALSRIGQMLYATSELFKKAVDMVVKFLRSPFYMFDGAEAKVIKDGIDSVAKTSDERVAIGNLIVGIAEDMSNHTAKDERLDVAYDQVEQVAKGDYDWKIERASQGLSM